MLTWIVIVFVAASFQLFRVNQAIYSSVAIAHTKMFDGAWQANCFNKTNRCIYNSDGHAQVKWDPTNMPEVIVQASACFGVGSWVSCVFEPGPTRRHRDATALSALEWAPERTIPYASVRGSAAV